MHIAFDKEAHDQIKKGIISPIAPDKLWARTVSESKGLGTPWTIRNHLRGGSGVCTGSLYSDGDVR